LKGGTRGVKFFGRIYLSLVPCELDQIQQDNACGEGRISRGQPRPPLQGKAQRSPNFGVSFYFYVHPLTQNYQIWRGNTYQSINQSLYFRQQGQ